MVPMDLAHFYHPWFQWCLKCAFDRGMLYSVAQGPGPGYLIFVFASGVSQGNAPWSQKITGWSHKCILSFSFMLSLDKHSYIKLFSWWLS